MSENKSMYVHKYTVEISYMTPNGSHGKMTRSAEQIFDHKFYGVPAIHRSVYDDDLRLICTELEAKFSAGKIYPDNLVILNLLFILESIDEVPDAQE